MNPLLKKLLFLLLLASPCLGFAQSETSISADHLKAKKKITLGGRVIKDFENVYSQSGTPTSVLGIHEGDIWIKTGTDSVFVHNGSAWVFLARQTEIDGSISNELAEFTASGSAPISPKQGDWWHKTPTDSLFIRDGGAWVFAAIRTASGGGSGGGVVGYVNANGDTLTNPVQKWILDVNNGNWISRNNGTSTQRTLENAQNVLLANAVTASGTSFTPNLQNGVLFRCTMTGGTVAINNATNNAVGRLGNIYRIILSNASGATATVTFGTTYDKRDGLDFGIVSVAAGDSLVYNFQSEYRGGAYVLTSMDVQASIKPIFLPSSTAILGSAGSDTNLSVATALDRVPTTSLAVGTVVEFIASNKLYTYILKATRPTVYENTPFYVFPNDFNTGTNNKYWIQAVMSQVVWDVTQYGASGQDTEPDSDAINAVMASASNGDVIWFPPGTYYVSSMGITKSCNWQGNGSILKKNAGHNSGVISIQAEDVTIDGFTLEGDGKTSGLTSQSGITVVGNGSPNLAIGRITISNCRFSKFASHAIGFNGTFTSKLDSLFTGSLITDCVIDNCFIGMSAQTRGEYWTISNSVFTRCDTGVVIGAGNIIVSGCQINNNKINVKVKEGVNDAHGVFVGCNINHSKGTTGILIQNVLNGHFFRACNIYYSRIDIKNSTGIVFDGCTIDVDSLRFQSSNVTVQNTTLGMTLTTAVNMNWNGGASTAYFTNNRLLNGTQPIALNFAASYRIGTYNLNTGQTLNSAKDKGVAYYNNSSGKIEIGQHHWGDAFSFSASIENVTRVDTLLNGGIAFGYFERMGDNVFFTLRFHVALGADTTSNAVFMPLPYASNFTDAVADVIGTASISAQGVYGGNPVKVERTLLAAETATDKIAVYFTVDKQGASYPANRVYISCHGSYLIKP